MLAMLAILASDGTAVLTAAERQPNMVVFFVDNLGYGDIGPFADTVHRTPRLDRMAAEGMKLTHFYYDGARLAAVRSERWKHHLANGPGAAKRRQTGVEPALFDLLADPAEQTDLAARHPEVVERLTELPERAREDLGDGDRPGKNQRPAGWVDSPRPLVMRE